MKICVGNFDVISSSVDESKIEQIVNERVDIALSDTLDEKLKYKADLDNSGKVLQNQIPELYNDVLEFDSFRSFPLKGEYGILYIDNSTGASYKWKAGQYEIIRAALDESYAATEADIRNMFEG